jgi:hypothetical protein
MDIAVSIAPSSSDARFDLPAKIATLCTYENYFGPCHPQTIQVLIVVAGAFNASGNPVRARQLLERALKDLDRGRHDPLSDLSIQVRRRLCDLLVEQRDFAPAAAVQAQIAECMAARYGSLHAETASARLHLADILFKGGPKCLSA